ncbi:DUF2635 domain-containing protein [Vibrio sp. DW001]|uniref:DUF2635 domain-containing protein n=1 Tax=Vibrio sp. DW001 TaxID=2912315 RepID=UPI0023B042A7|nr:DUF2635 domain-containing protein [Vibrio sp. DW001]WED29869.1 DUF2635 domain-containing protein [Vibrio sp. DW001]
MATFKVKPKQGLLVRDPDTRTPLKAEGEEKPRDTYWLRRIKDGSVTQMTSNTKASTVRAKKETAS